METELEQLRAENERLKRELEDKSQYISKQEHLEVLEKISLQFMSLIHDVRATLASVGGFVDVTLHHFAEEFSEEAKQMLEMGSLMSQYLRWEFSELAAFNRYGYLERHWEGYGSVQSLAENLKSGNPQIKIHIQEGISRELFISTVHESICLEVILTIWGRAKRCKMEDGLSFNFLEDSSYLILKMSIESAVRSYDGPIASSVYRLGGIAETQGGEFDQKSEPDLWLAIIKFPLVDPN